MLNLMDYIRAGGAVVHDSYLLPDKRETSGLCVKELTFSRMLMELESWLSYETRLDKTEPMNSM
jgi:hypothetical protein